MILFHGGLERSQFETGPCYKSWRSVAVKAWRLSCQMSSNVLLQLFVQFQVVKVDAVYRLQITCNVSSLHLPRGSVRVRDARPHHGRRNSIHDQF